MSPLPTRWSSLRSLTAALRSRCGGHAPCCLGESAESRKGVCLSHPASRSPDPAKTTLDPGRRDLLWPCRPLPAMDHGSVHLVPKPLLLARPRHPIRIAPSLSQPLPEPVTATCTRGEDWPSVGARTEPGCEGWVSTPVCERSRGWGGKQGRPDTGGLSPRSQVLAQPRVPEF